jgi:hypothetical protein
MRKYMLFFSIGLANCLCYNKVKEDCSLLKYSFDQATVGLKVALPKYKIVDSIAYKGFDQTLLFSYKLEVLRGVGDTLTLYIIVNNYNYPETKHFLNFETIKNKLKREIEYPLNEKNMIEDTILNLGGFKVGCMKYFIDPQKTNYSDKSRKKHYDSTIFFFKNDLFIEIEILEPAVYNKLNGSIITDCIIEHLRLN